MGPKREIAQDKAAQIREASDGGLVFADSNHCFIKGFGWPLMEVLDPASVGINVLKRDPAKIIDSTLRIRCVPLHTVGPDYILMPDRLNPLVAPPSFCGVPGKAGLALARVVSKAYRGGRRALNLLGASIPRDEPFAAYQRGAIDWYIRETEALEQAFRETYAECRYFETDVGSLNDPDHVQAMLQYFGLSADVAGSSAVGVPVNLKR